MKKEKIRYFLTSEEVQGIAKFNLWQPKEDVTTFTEIFMWFQAFMCLYSEHEYEVTHNTHGGITFTEETFDEFGTKIGIGQREYDNMPSSLEYIHEKLTEHIFKK